jgi:hypothetical protein
MGPWAMDGVTYFPKHTRDRSVVKWCARKLDSQERRSSMSDARGCPIFLTETDRLAPSETSYTAVQKSTE